MELAQGRPGMRDDRFKEYENEIAGYVMMQQGFF